MKKIISAILFIGISSVTAQIILLRELFIVFSGNELSIGIILANWLFWTTIGSFAGGKLLKGSNQPVIPLASSEIILSFFLIVTILFIRGIKLIVHSAPGEILGLFPIWLYSFILLSGVCIVNGILFVEGCSSYKKIRAGLLSEEIIGKVYIIESIGAGLGGLICSIFLIKYFNAIQIIWFLVLANLFISGLLWKKIRWIIFSGFAAIFILGVYGVTNTLNIETRKWQWPGYTIIETKESIYGNVTVTKRDLTYSFFESGLLSFSVPDVLSSEETAHLSLLQCPSPKKILLVGGGAGGILEEILKYPSIESISYVELDPLIIKLAKDILPAASLNNPKVNIYNIDGRRFLKATVNLYDVIIVNLPDPSTAQLNRFYTEEFFKGASRHLNKDGILSIGASSSENYISLELGDYLRCIYYTLKEVFPVVKVIPGEYCRFIAGKNKEFISDDYKTLIERLNVKAQYITNSYLKDKLNPEKVQYIYDQLVSKKARFLNSDFHPVCYYYNIVYWSTYFNDVLKKIFHSLEKIKLWHFAVFLIIAVLLPRFKRKNSVLLSLITGGFSGMSVQILVILGFQVIYGYIYYKLGIIITGFMIGLAFGSFYVNKILKKSGNDYSLFLKTQIAITIYPLILPMIFHLFAKTERLSFLGENIIFPCLPVIAGLITGFQFPLGNKIYINVSGKKEIEHSVGITYGMDLLGACVGALLISAFMLPVLGISQTCFITAIINLGVLIILFRNRL